MKLFHSVRSFVALFACVLALVGMGRPASAQFMHDSVQSAWNATWTSGQNSDHYIALSVSQVAVSLTTGYELQESLTLNITSFSYQYYNNQYTVISSGLQTVGGGTNLGVTYLDDQTFNNDWWTSGDGTHTFDTSSEYAYAIPPGGYSSWGLWAHGNAPANWYFCVVKFHCDVASKLFDVTRGDTSPFDADYITVTSAGIEYGL